jgi:hypothetical protein
VYGAPFDTLRIAAAPSRATHDSDFGTDGLEDNLCLWVSPPSAIPFFNTWVIRQYELERRTRQVADRLDEAL